MRAPHRAGPRARDGPRKRPHLWPPSADEAEAPIDADVALVAKHRDGEIGRRDRAVDGGLGLGELNGPARVAILVAQLGGLGLPFGRDTPRLDRGLLLSRVALARIRDQRGVRPRT